jgi:hypothetical protein
MDFLSRFFLLNFLLLKLMLLFFQFAFLASSDLISFRQKDLLCFLDLFLVCGIRHLLFSKLKILLLFFYLFRTSYLCHLRTPSYHFDFYMCKLVVLQIKNHHLYIYQIKYLKEFLEGLLLPFQS